MLFKLRCFSIPIINQYNSLIRQRNSCGCTQSISTSKNNLYLPLSTIIGCRNVQTLIYPPKTMAHIDLSAKSPYYRYARPRVRTPIISFGEVISIANEKFQLNNEQGGCNCQTQMFEMGLGYK